MYGSETIEAGLQNLLLQEGASLIQSRKSVGIGLSNMYTEYQKLEKIINSYRFNLLQAANHSKESALIFLGFSTAVPAAVMRV